MLGHSSALSPFHGLDSGSDGVMHALVVHGLMCLNISGWQAYLWLHPDGRFRVKNVGRRHIFVNARQVCV